MKDWTTTSYRSLAPVARGLPGVSISVSIHDPAVQVFPDSPDELGEGAITVLRHLGIHGALTIKQHGQFQQWPGTPHGWNVRDMGAQLVACRDEDLVTDNAEIKPTGGVAPMNSTLTRLRPEWLLPLTSCSIRQVRPDFG
jgi:hypothetical protein